PRRSEKLSQCVGRVPRHKATGVARPGFPAQNFSRQRGWGEVHRTHVYLVRSLLSGETPNANRTEYHNIG
ncbi:hypothetical protein, partial [Nostoc sp. FACHB-152]|uniref:hypothetical protein n=1 Tax=Nostoc sp. FACHB-152 TaxID=2692837 RepID=UPI001A7EE0EE